MVTSKRHKLVDSKSTSSKKQVLTQKMPSLEFSSTCRHYCTCHISSEQHILIGEGVDQTKNCRNRCLNLHASASNAEPPY